MFQSGPIHKLALAAVSEGLGSALDGESTRIWNYCVRLQFSLEKASFISGQCLRSFAQEYLRTIVEWVCSRVGSGGMLSEGSLEKQK